MNIAYKRPRLPTHEPSRNDTGLGGVLTNCGRLLPDSFSSLQILSFPLRQRMWPQRYQAQLIDLKRLCAAEVRPTSSTRASDKV